MSTYINAETTRRIEAAIEEATITVEFDHWRDEGLDGRCAAYRVTIEVPGMQSFTDNTLHGPLTGRDPGARAMLASACAFLGAAAEAYDSQMRRPAPTSADLLRQAHGIGTTSRSENLNLFPPAVTEWAYQNSDEISILGLTLEEE